MYDIRKLRRDDYVLVRTKVSCANCCFTDAHCTIIPQSIAYNKDEWKCYFDGKDNVFKLNVSKLFKEL